MSEAAAANECTRRTEAAQGCTHWEGKSPAFFGHCSNDPCPNSMEACPLHQTPAVQEA